MADQPTITLREGRAIPQLGFGVFRIPPRGRRLLEAETGRVAAVSA